MKPIFAFVMLIVFFTAPVSAERINPDLDLVQFWTHSNSDQDESIDIFVTQLASIILQKGGSFTSSYSSLSGSARVSAMKSCMKDYGIPHGSVGEAYVLCVQKLRWLEGVD
jgi:hypothetical protein